MNDTVVRRRRALTTVGGALLLIVGTLVLIPWHPLDEPSDIEQAWALALHLAFLRGLAFGREFVFSFGPWGFISRGYHPDTYLLSLLIWATFSAIFIESVWSFARRHGSRFIASLAVVAGVITILFRSRESLLFALPLLWFLEGREQPRSVRFFVLTVATALAALGKFSLLLCLLPLAALLAFDEIFRRRRPPWSLAAIAAAVLGWWLAAGQRIGDAIPFFRHGLEIAGRYADAMALMPNDVTAPLNFVAASALLAIVVFIGGRASGRPWFWLDVLAFANVAFFAFKAAFVRWDYFHVSEGYGTLLLLIVIGASMNWRPLSARHPELKLLIPLLPLLVIAASTADPTDFLDQRMFRQSARDVTSIISGGWPAHRRSLNEEFERFVSDAERKTADLRMEGTVDVYPVLASTVARLERYAPRPIPQSYAAYSPLLARLNADHLQDVGPDQILFDIAPIDERHPALDDASSWPHLLAYYEVAGQGSSLLLLERRMNPRRLQFHPLGTGSYAIGEGVTLPPFLNPIWAEIHIEKSLLGHLASFFLKAPVVTLEVRTTERQDASQFRLPIALASGGFILSPAVPDRAAFAELVEQPEDNRLPRVVGIRVVADERFYEPRVRISLAAIEFNPPD